MGDEFEKKPKRKNGPGRPFVKGGPSPNPGGRPISCREVRALAQEMSPSILQRLYEIAMSSRNHMAATKAGIEVLNRALGQSPSMSLQVTGDATGDIDRDMSGLSALLARARLGKAQPKLNKPEPN